MFLVERGQNGLTARELAQMLDAPRTSVADLLKAEGIQTSIHYPPIHHFSAFRETSKDVHLPVTEAFASRELTLPLYPSLAPDQVDTIVSSVVNAINDKTRADHNVGLQRR